MKRLIFVAAALSLLCVLGSAAPADKPNVLFISVDDLNDFPTFMQRYPDAKTPHLDKLAERGMAFTQAHCQFPLCGPSRASVMSGLLPSTLGYEGHMKDEALQGRARELGTELMHAWFARHGYKTMAVGKILHHHVPEGSVDLSGGRGAFNEGTGNLAKNWPQKRTSTDWAMAPERDQDLPDHNAADWAAKQLEAEHDKPFFLMVGILRPHVPWYVPKKWFDLYDKDQLTLPPYDPNDLDDVPAIAKEISILEQMPRTDWAIETNQWRDILHAYLACVSFADHQVGRVLEALEKSPYRDNTIVVLWSDHGYHLGEKNTFQKQSLWERSSHVPLAIAGPQVKAGQRCDRVVSLLDLYPTLLEMCGLPANPKNQGSSLLPLLVDPAREWPFPAITGWLENSFAVQTERYRYIRYGDGSEELYDHQNDLDEWTNLAKKPATEPIRRELAEHLVKLGVIPPAPPTNPGFADHETLVSETHAASLKLREEALRKTIAKDTAWPSGVWGDNLWNLAALYRNEKVDVANARLLKQANDYIDLTRKRGRSPAPTPEQPGNAPWTFFSITDYVRTLCLFHSKSPHFPGRLAPATETAMKEALWLWVSGESRMADTGVGNLFLLLGTENHDLNRRPNYYLVTALLKEDPDYRDRKLVDGHTLSEHADAHAAFLREWPRRRAASGLWVEAGSNTYQKYSWPALFNLHELAPDPVIRKRFGLLLDLAFIEEEQISVRGRRGGGRSRADYAVNAFESYKNLLFAPEGQPSGSSHSRVIETSRYQLPPEAILLRYRAFPATKPFVIRNRVIGELEVARSADEDGQRLAGDSALVNYAYRTPHYLLGSTLQNPALAMPDPETGAPALKYSGISRQKRACGLLFDDPSAGTIGQIHPVVEHPGGGRPQHSFWSVQHENVLVLQRIARHGRSTLGSYNTGKLGMRFEGVDLEKVEEDGWIFASTGKVFVGVKFLDGGHLWDEKKVEAYPANFTGPGDSTRILLHVGDMASHGSFDKFRAAVFAGRLCVDPDKVDYRFGPADTRIVVTSYDPKAHGSFTLPRIDGKPVDLRPATTYESPFLNGDFGGDRISANVGPMMRALDFSEQGE